MTGIVRALLGESLLQEGAVQRYGQMFTGLSKLASECERLSDEVEGVNYSGFEQSITNEVNWARRHLRREDRIVWFLRLARPQLYLNLFRWCRELVKYMSTHGEYLYNDKSQINEIMGRIHDLKDRVGNEFKKYKTQIEHSYGITINTSGFVVRYSYQRTGSSKSLTGISSNLEHYLSLDLPAIDRIRFDTQNPIMLIMDMQEIEQRWTESRSGMVDMEQYNTPGGRPDEIEKIIEFPDGSAWFNLNRAACSIEGDAMGHCGNSPDAYDHDLTVLSYRVPVGPSGRPRKAGEPDRYWRSKLTFILNTQTGELGEMKGRANTKPKPELHPYIIALLKHPMINGITGGGYRPEENFDISDLSREARADLIAEKPVLGTLKDVYERFGKSPQTAGKIISILGKKSHGISLVQYDETTEVFSLRKFSWKPLQGLGNALFVDHDEIKTLRIASGDTRLIPPEISETNPHMVRYFCKMISQQNPDLWASVVYWIKKDANLVKEFSGDWSDGEAVASAILDLDVFDEDDGMLSGIYALLGSAIRSSVNANYEEECRKSVQKWLKDPFVTPGAFLAVSGDPFAEGGSEIAIKTKFTDELVETAMKVESGETPSILEKFASPKPLPEFDRLSLLDLFDFRVSLERLAKFISALNSAEKKEQGES